MFDYIVQLNEIKEIQGISIVCLNGKQPLRFAVRESDFENLKSVAEVIESLDPREYFKDLMDFEYRGLGHLTLDDFDIFLAKIDDDNLFLLLTSDASTAMFNTGQKIVDEIRQLVKKDEAVQQIEDITAELKGKMIEKNAPIQQNKKKEISKQELMSQLRGKLDSLN
ncbi:MAG: hypothetical protein IH840_01340 [Candidatus Heimdallarchaeota archaeon]|nr:hypothetical protein [Candidatus Heimdallarchaeota archaeon]